jgi:hypothetical protein
VPADDVAVIEPARARQSELPMEHVLPPVPEVPTPPIPIAPAIPPVSVAPTDIRPVREPVPEAAASSAARVMADLPAVSMELPADSGLQLVETVRRPAPAEPQSPEPPAPRRVRPPRVELADEPLQIVETRKEQPPAQ